MPAPVHGMRRFRKLRTRRIDRDGIRGRIQKTRPVISDEWIQKMLERIEKCAKRLNAAGALETDDIQKWQRDLSNIRGEQEQYPGKSKTQKRHQIYTAFLKRCIQEFGPYMALLCSCALACRPIADAGKDKRDALIERLKTKDLMTERLVTLASKHGVAGHPAEDFQFEYTPSVETTHAILNKMKEDNFMRLICSISVESAEERPHLTFAIDRDIFWDIVNIANADDRVTYFIDQDLE